MYNSKFFLRPFFISCLFSVLLRKLAFYIKSTKFYFCFYKSASFLFFLIMHRLVLITKNNVYTIKMNIEENDSGQEENSIDHV
jgi:hypothetical protein